MKTERTDVDFPLWRKKVDSSLFLYNGTTIPKWVCKVWNLDELFPGLKGKRDPTSEVAVTFKKKPFVGQITCSWPKKRADKVYRLWFDDELKTELKETFLMSYMRDIESRLSPGKKRDVEREIPFWEFLDIEFDEVKKVVRMSAHYTQVPTFPELFHRLTYSPALKRIDDELNNKHTVSIKKQDWRPREEFEAEIGAENVIYMLIDTEAKLLYVGEAARLIPRFRSGHPSIRDWNYYRYDALPEALRDVRVALERMVIRNFATVLPNKRNIQSIQISEYALANDKIDV